MTLVLDLNEILNWAVDQEGSDLHVKVGAEPRVRVDGRLVASPFAKVTAADADRIAKSILPKDRSAEFASTNEADFALSVPKVGRFRVNVFRQRNSVGMVFRRVLPGIPSLESLGLPPVVSRLADEQKGLVLVTGPTASGRTSTVAAMVDHINESRSCNIVTIEDPVEVLHVDKKAMVNQREIGTDTADYTSAMKRVLRQDPDVIFIDVLRDPDTVAAALAAADTGQLVISTMPTSTATDTVDRVVEFFPPAQQRQIRLTLASSLRGVVSQRLLERADGRGRIPAVEVLVGTAKVYDKIVEPSGRESIEDLIADGEYHGMQTLDQSLFTLYKNGLVGYRDAMAAATHPQDLRVAFQQAGLDTYSN